MKRTTLLTAVSAGCSLAVAPVHAAPRPKALRAPISRPALPGPVRLASGWQFADAAHVTATGEALSRADFTPKGWQRAVVPGTILTSLVAAGVYPDPLYGENNRPDRIPDSLCRTSWWYRTSFTVPRSYAGKRTWLRFNGVNYIAEVWVNGRSVGTVKGAFARGLFDVTSFVKAGRLNALAVHVLPPPHPGATHEKTQATGTGHNGGATAQDGPNFLCTVGWDWIPTIRDRDTGLWQDVSLYATGPVVVQDPYVTSDLPLPRTDTADVTVQATLRNVTNEAQTGVLRGSIGAISFYQRVILRPMETRTVTFSPATTPRLRIHNPRLWWPNGYGRPDLYRLRLRFDTGSGTSDAQELNFGIRKITYFRPGSDNLALSVNGVPILCKGGNWGMDEAMKRIPRKRLDAQVRMHQLAHYTMIRNWVGQSTSEDFYDACDRYGILVWDEFFQPNPADGPNPDDANLYLANVREKLLRFRNHPCIALWCGRNEGNPPPLIDKGNKDLTTNLDPGRFYQANSSAGHGVRSSGPYFWRPPQDFYNIDCAFKTEIGAPSIPTLEAVHAMMPPKDWETINDDWAEHDLCSGAQAGDQYPARIAQRYGSVTSLADFVRKAQMANYECFRAMYEGRIAKLFQPVTGVITWMSNPAQPSFVWQLYSHDLEPNASLFAVRKACEPVHIQMNQATGHLMVINNTPHLLSDLRACVRVVELDGAVRYDHTDSATAASSAATDLGAIPFPEGLSPVHLVKLELRDRAGTLISDNLYWRSAPDGPDEFPALQEMPSVALTATLRRRDTNGRVLLTVMLRNPTRTPALLAHIQLRRGRSGHRVLPVFCSDNYVSLLPGEERTLTVEAERADLGGEKPLLVVDGWNVTVAPKNFAGASVAPNREAQVTPETPRGLTITYTHPARVNCGGGTVDGFAADTDVDGGNLFRSNARIDTSAPHAAPEEVYRTERWGECTYRLVPPDQNATYTVRLHFAENTYDHPGARLFNVDINGRRVLTSFDIYAEAGAPHKAVVKDFAGIRPERGVIAIHFTRAGADQPKVSAIEVLPGE